MPVQRLAVSRQGSTLAADNPAAEPGLPGRWPEAENGLGRRLPSIGDGAERPRFKSLLGERFLLGDAGAPQGGRDQMSRRDQHGEIGRKGLE
jgi:hypothetical protein